MLNSMWAGFRNLAVFTILVSVVAQPQAQGRLDLAGLAVYTDTARDIYVAGLRTADGQPVPDLSALQGPIIMEYRITTRRISARGFSGTLLLQAELGSGERAPDAVVDALGELKRTMKGSLLMGDQFEIGLTERGNTVFNLDGTRLFDVDGAETFAFLIQGWLGSSASALLREPLSSRSLDDGIMTRFESLIPLNERVDTVAAWGNDAAEEPQQVAAAPEPATTPEPEPEPQVAAAPEPEPEPEVDAGAAAAAAVAAAATAAAATPEPVQVASAPEPEPQPEPLPELPPSSEPVVAQLEPEPELEPELEPAAPATDDRASALAEMDDREYQRQLNEYLAQVLGMVFREVRYPRRAVNRELEGKVEMLAEISLEGKLLGVEVLETSGHGLLDRAAIAAVEEGAPFPPLSAVAQEEFLSDDGENYVLMIPVNFRLQ
ncbi:hypothetical protein A3709_04060 [Halioglobus sp. HI00S01]|uniref:energy transducer TonB n=1 Tax=Halioglobus sp. HI00S01 TaxID=1822214 RepID=UPI0007C319C1|nr:energy transducer TonB [Halioglobus sp. HI00S01]KZX56955.1 hypothetical protein A3709_04060 [Halioglobus sp. HI00S01]